MNIKTDFFSSDKYINIYDSTIKMVCPELPINKSLIFGFLEPNFKVLDLGCGTGNLVNEFLKLEIPFSYLGIDLDLASQEIAKKKFLGIANVRFETEDFFLHRNNDFYDLIISQYTLHHYDVNEIAPLFENVFFMLKKGGRFINIDLYSNLDVYLQKASLNFDLDFINGNFDKQIENQPQNLEELSNLKKLWINHYLNHNKMRKLEEDLNLAKNNNFESIELISRNYNHTVVQFLK